MIPYDPGSRSSESDPGIHFRDPPTWLSVNSRLRRQHEILVIPGLGVVLLGPGEILSDSLGSLVIHQRDLKALIALVWAVPRSVNWALGPLRLPSVLQNGPFLLSRNPRKNPLGLIV